VDVTSMAMAGQTIRIMRRSDYLKKIEEEYSPGTYLMKYNFK
jgi:hypothetical protein